MMRRPWYAALIGVSLALAGAVEAAPHGSVILKDGRRFDDVEYDVRGNNIRIKTSAYEFELPLDQVARLQPTAGGAPANGGGEAAPAVGEGEAAPPSAEDWATRSMFTAPEGWLVQAPTSPVVRIQLQHPERNASLRLTVKPASGPWLSGEGRQLRVEREVNEGIKQDLAALYQRQPNPRLEVTDYFGTPAVLLAPLEVKLHGDDTVRRLTEVRFRQFGLDYAVSLLVSKDDAGAVEHQVHDLLRAFSFLPSLAASESGYSDYLRGIALERPNEDWTIEARPFDDDQPLRMVTAGGRGLVEVRVARGEDPAAWVRDSLRERKRASSYFAGERTEETTQDGSPATRFEFRDFREEGRKQLQFKGFAARVRGKVVVVTGVAPITDEDAPKIQEEVDRVLGSVRLHDMERIQATLQSAFDCMSAISQGSDAIARRDYAAAIDLLTRAIEARPGFAQAYYIRALAKKGAQDFTGFREDLKKAAELDPDAGYDGELIDGYAAEAAAAKRAQDWPEAMRLYKQVYASRRDTNTLRELLAVCRSRFNDLKKDNVSRGVSEMESALSRWQSQDQVAQFLATVYRDGATQALKENQHGRARGYANKLKRLPGQEAAAERLLEQIQRAQERR